MSYECRKSAVRILCLFRTDVSLMIFLHAVHRRLVDLAALEAVVGEHFLQHVLIVVSDRTYEADWRLRILRKDALHEIVEMVVHELVDHRILDIVGAELRKRSEEAVGERLAVHFLDDVGLSQLIFREELLLQFVGELVLQQVRYKALAQYRTRTFIAQDIAESRNILHDLFAVEIAGVAASAQDAGYTGILAASGERCAQHIALYRHLSVLEASRDGFGYGRLLLRSATRAVEIHVRDRTHPKQTGHLRKQLVLDRIADGVARLLERIDAIGKKLG